MELKTEHSLPDVAADSIFQRQTVFGTKDGVRIEKGVVLTEDYLNNHFDDVCNIWQLFSVYPDIFLDVISTDETKIRLLPYQRVFLRAVMRFRTVYVCACRAWSKSFLTILALFLQCVFMPGCKRFVCAPGKSQSAQIAKEKITEIYDNWPLLKKEVIGWELKDIPGNFSKDSVTIKFRNGSQLDVVAPLDSTRGGRRHGFENFFDHLRFFVILAIVFHSYIEIEKYKGLTEGYNLTPERTSNF